MHETDKLESPVISIITPVYNAEKFLGKCIESVLNQSYKNIELLLVDDGSTDNSGEICNKYALEDGRIKVIKTENNGPGAARNTGILNSRGDFIFFLDADDFIENSALELLIEKTRDTDVDIIVGDFIKVNGANSSSGHNRVFENNKLLEKKDVIEYSRSYLKKPNRFPLFAYSWGRLFKSSIIKQNNVLYNTNLRTFEDVAFNFDYLNHVNKIFFVNEVIYNHLVHDNYSSATMAISDRSDQLFGFKYALQSIADFLKRSEADIDIKREVGHADVFLTIIQFVRTCGQINNDNKKKIYKTIKDIVDASFFRENLSYYTPSKGDSKLLPLLMRLKLIKAIILVCGYKARKRYGKGNAKK